MAIRKYMFFLSVLSILATGSLSFAHGPGNAARGNYGIRGANSTLMNNYMLGMMGGHGMGNGGQMMRGYGDQDYGFGNLPDLVNRYRNTPDAYDQRPHYNRDKIENLKLQIKQKRGELADLYRSKSADKQLVDRKISELNRLEQRMDELLSYQR